MIDQQETEHRWARLYRQVPPHLMPGNTTALCALDTHRNIMFINDEQFAMLKDEEKPAALRDGPHVWKF